MGKSKNGFGTNGDNNNKPLEPRERLREIADAIIEIKESRKELNEKIDKLLGEAEYFGIPKKAMRLAIALREYEKRDEFDQGYLKARAALDIPILQLEMKFDE